MKLGPSTLRHPRRLLVTLGVALLPAALALGAVGSAEAAAPRAKKKPAAAAEGAETASVPAGSPLEQLRKTNADLKKVLQRQKPSWSPEAELKNTEVKRLVDDLLDFEELGRRALAKHWDGLKPAQRTEFVNTLRELVERNYLKQMYGQPDYDIKFGEETIKGKEAVVTATLVAKRKGKKVNIALEHKLVQKGGRWVVYDVVTDELSLLENYRAEFNKIINKDGFEALLGRMKKKLSDRG